MRRKFTLGDTKELDNRRLRTEKLRFEYDDVAGDGRGSMVIIVISNSPYLILCCGMQNSRHVEHYRLIEIETSRDVDISKL